MAGTERSEVDCLTESSGSPNAATWQRIRLCVEAETGMDFSGKRLGRLCDAVKKAFPRHKTIAELDQLLARGNQQHLGMDQLAAELTVGESFFFRNSHHFRALREHVIPEILRDIAEQREIRVWSAGCATGEEPYSLAILLDQILRGNSSWRVSILGTDLNPLFLERAREACYRSWSFRQTNIQNDRAYFTPQGDSFRVADRVRQSVRFSYLNLVKDVYPSPLTGTLGLSLILFRNVAIYLKPEVTKAIIDRFYGALRPGGWLLLGETEVTGAPAGSFQVRRFDQATLYQKPREHSSTSTGEYSQQPPLPVLADVSFARDPSLLTVPTLPEWSPLPQRKPSVQKRSTGLPAAMSAAKVGSAAAVAMQWDGVERLLAGRHFDEAKRTIERVANPNDRAALRLRFVRALLSCAEVALARRMLDACLKESPLLIEAQLLQAGFAEEAGDLAAAEQACRRALYIDPKAPMAHFHLALILDRKGDRKRAAKSFGTTMKLIEGKDAHALVEHGEGVCNGRLKEMVAMLLDF